MNSESNPKILDKTEFIPLKPLVELFRNLMILNESHTHTQPKICCWMLCQGIHENHCCVAIQEKRRKRRRKKNWSRMSYRIPEENHANIKRL